MTYSIAIAVQNPRQVAEALVEIWQGHCIPFPFLPNSYVVLPKDPAGTSIEIFPADTELVLAETEETVAAFYAMLANRTTGIYEPISVPSTLTQIERVAHAMGWPVQVDVRHLSGRVALWIDNHVMLELLPMEFVQPPRVTSQDLKRLTLSQSSCPH